MARAIDTIRNPSVLDSLHTLLQGGHWELLWYPEPAGDSGLDFELRQDTTLVGFVSVEKRYLIANALPAGPSRSLRRKLTTGDWTLLERWAGIGIPATGKE